MFRVRVDGSQVTVAHCSNSSSFLIVPINKKQRQHDWEKEKETKKIICGLTPHYDNELTPLSKLLFSWKSFSSPNFASD